MTQKVFLTKSGTAKIQCPECGKTRQMDVSKFKNIEKQVKLKASCVCKHQFTVLLERRKYIRMPVNLKGKVFLNGKTYHASVINISRYGLRFTTSGAMELNLLDKIILEFQLDDAAQSMVKKEIVIKTIKRPEFGAEFVERDHYDKLGTYLLFHFS